MKNKVRVTFSKSEPVKYISHLDFVRMWQRTFKRAKLALVYSQGFNPHPVMSFLSPLSVGFTSECEVIFVEFPEYIAEDEVIERLNRALPTGLFVTKVEYIPEGEKREKISNALYNIELSVSEGMRFDADKFMERIEIIADKKTKSGTKPTDIREDIIDLSMIEQTEDKLIFNLTVATGDVRNLNPKVVLDAMSKYTDGLLIKHYKINRLLFG